MLVRLKSPEGGETMKSTVCKLLMIAVCASLVPSIASSSGFTGWRDIEWVYQRQCTTDRGFEIRLTEAQDNPDGCSNPDVIEIQCAVQPYQTAVDIALTILATGGQIRAFVNGCDGEGQAIVKALQGRPPAPPEQ